MASCSLVREAQAHAERVGQATICHTVAPSDSVWDQVKHAASAACERGGAYLTGQYAFRFSNTSRRTAKLHLVDDEPSAGCARDPRDYFLTLPAGADSVEVPMSSSFITVHAGFFYPEEGIYEIFWEKRRFSWQPNCKMVAKASHSVDVNKFRVDVWPGAPEARRLSGGLSGGLGRGSTLAGTVSFDPARAGAQPLLALPMAEMAADVTDSTPSASTRSNRGNRSSRSNRNPTPSNSEPDASLSPASHYRGPTLSATELMNMGVRAYTLGPQGQGWMAANVTVLSNGALQVEDADGKTEVSPSEKACLVGLPSTWKDQATPTLSMATESSAPDSVATPLRSSKLGLAADSIDLARSRRPDPSVVSMQTGTSARSSRGASMQTGGVSMQTGGASTTPSGGEVSASTRSGSQRSRSGEAAGRSQPAAPSVEASPSSTGCSSAATSQKTIQIWSQAHNSWVDAEVVEVQQDGTVVVQFGASKKLRSLRREEQQRLIRVSGDSL